MLQCHTHHGANMWKLRKASHTHLLPKGEAREISCDPSSSPFSFHFLYLPDGKQLTTITSPLHTFISSPPPPQHTPLTQAWSYFKASNTTQRAALICCQFAGGCSENTVISEWMGIMHLNVSVFTMCRTSIPQFKKTHFLCTLTVHLCFFICQTYK